MSATCPKCQTDHITRTGTEWEIEDLRHCRDVLASTLAEYETYAAKLAKAETKLVEACRALKRAHSGLISHDCYSYGDKKCVGCEYRDEAKAVLDRLNTTDGDGI